jgi:hypothetical protein
VATFSNISGDLYQIGRKCRSSDARTTYNFVHSGRSGYNDNNKLTAEGTTYIFVRSGRSGYNDNNKLTTGDYSTLLEHYCEIILIVVF